MIGPTKKQRRAMAATLRKIARMVEKRGLWMTVHADLQALGVGSGGTCYRVAVEVKAPRKRRVAL